MRKRLFSILFAQCMVLCLVPTTAFAEDSMEETAVCTCEMPDTQSEAALAQMSGEGENGIAVQSAGVAIDNTNFPDANFCSFVASSFDEDNDNYLSNTEINAAENINCADKGISDLTGISHFTALKRLYCDDNQLTSLDVSKNTALTYLDCYDNQLTSLDVSKNTALTYLDCYGNQLTSLDVSKNTALTYLDCGRNQLTSLDVSKNTALTYLDCRSNQLTKLDVSKNTALTELDCRSNRLTKLDVSKNTALTTLYCWDNQLTKLDVSKNTALTDLACYKNQLTSLDVSKNTALTELDCDKNQLTSLDISNTNIMYDLNCSGNVYQIIVGNNRAFDLSTLPGNFDVAKTSKWSGGTVSGSTLTVDSDKDTVTYKYDCGKGKNVTFTLKCVESADYANVDEAIAKANALNKDDYKDFSAVDSAVNAVVRDKDITEQSEVDAMAKTIEDAIAALQYRDADYTKVDEAIAKANALKKDDYKDFSAVEAAVNAVVRGKNITEQSEVDAMAKAIEDAIAALQYRDADYTKVDEAIAKANALKKDDYKDFSAVEAAVNAVVRGKNITEQSEVDAMAKAIENAIATLEKKPSSTKAGTSDKSLKTGDTSNLALWIALLFVSGGAAIGTTVVSRKKKYNR